MTEKGQHLRLIFTTFVGTAATTGFVTMAKTLTFHLSKQMENSTTKDTTDTNGNWAEFEPVENSGDIQFSGLVAVPVGSDSTKLLLADFLDHVTDEVVSWKLAMVSGSQNRVVGKTVCSGQGKITNVKVDGQMKQNATFSGTINLVGPVTVGND